MPSSGNLDSQVEPGFSKSREYDRHRATYPADAIQALLENVQINGKSEARILDLAAGTGKLTEALAFRDERFEIVAVEPLGSMRRVLEEKKLPRVDVRDGQAAKIPVDDASVDAVLVAQVSD